MPKIILLVVVVLLVAAAFCGPAAAPPDKPLILGGSNFAVLRFDVNAKPEVLNDPKLWDALDAHPGKDHWRMVGNNTFNDDQPEFKSLMADPDCKGDNWITTGNGKKISHSEALPADESKIEQIVGKYAR